IFSVQTTIRRVRLREATAKNVGIERPLYAGARGRLHARQGNVKIFRVKAAGPGRFIPFGMQVARANRPHRVDIWENVVSRGDNTDEAGGCISMSCARGVHYESVVALARNHPRLMETP